ncbi:MAG: alkaline phosphatase D family protein [Flavobacteriaceae bacterium]
MKNAHIIFLFFTLFASAQQDVVLTKINRNNITAIDDFFDPGLAPFYHGVASGDPTDSAVIIWTRVTTNASSAVVNWKVATDPSMTDVVKTGAVTTDADIDYTVKIDVTNLNPNTSYYYQFETSGQHSLIGKTRTAPVGNIANVRFGVVSCSNYQNGYFNGYQELANRTDIDAIVHLGDYIYEYETGGYGYDDAIGRGHLPENEIITLSDYRVRYSYYRLDAMLRNLHQQHPFILIWDDHEFSNDANKYGAENHNPATEGDWNVRKHNAYKAYFEWMPVRANTIEEYRLYRTLSYGNLLDLIMLDTRIEGRDEVVTANAGSLSKTERKAVAKSLIESASLESVEHIKMALKQVAPLFVNVSKITLLEYEYLLNTFANAAYIFKQTNEKIYLPVEVEQKLTDIIKKSSYAHEAHALSKEMNKANYTSILGIEQYNWLLNELSSSAATWRILGNQVMFMPYDGVPTDDAWDGYSDERDNILKHLDDNSITNNVILTGDIHSMFSGVAEYNNSCQAVEFVVPSITSENLDAYGGVASWLAELWTMANNGHMSDVSLDAHGYFILDVKEHRVQADWYNMVDITVPNSGQTYYKSWYTDKDQCNLVETNTPAEQLLSYGDFPDDISSYNTSNDEFVIMGVYPNPMSEQGNVHYMVNSSSIINVSIFTINGKKVKELLLNKKHNNGLYNLSFSVNGLSTGNYILKMDTGSHSVSKKIIIN